MSKLNIVVLMGGKSSEHEISVISGSEVVKRLDPKKYNVLPVVVSKDGNKWLSLTKEELLSLPNPLKFKGTSKEIVRITSDSKLTSANNIHDSKCDLVFIAMHGPFGEDGTVQGLLDLADIKYTGSGVLASAVGMNKSAFRKIMRGENISIPKNIEVKKGEDYKKSIKLIGKLPYFVKPVGQGSSVGMSIVRKKNDLKKALDLAFKYDKSAFIDEYIKGIELTCAVMGNDKPFALPVIEIIPKKGEFFDYESKYTESGSDEIVPARISKALTKKVQEIAIRVYKAIGCQGFSRVDFLIKNKKTPVVLEVNTIPGLTPMSLFPKAAKAYGLSYPKLLDKVISLSLEKYS